MANLTKRRPAAIASARTRPPRFFRSANVERDQAGAAMLGYVPTSRAVELVERVVDALEDGHGVALSVIGPYGSGKSSAVLFLHALLGANDNAETKLARRKLKSISKDLERRLAKVLRRLECHHSGVQSALAVARREAILDTVARALSGNSAQTTSSRKGRKATPGLESLLESRLNKRPLLLVLDEFGKNLEHFADNPSDSDLFVLQQLAERAVSGAQRPLVVLTLQHLAFEEYLSFSTPVAQREWAKIQGRFADFSFVESTRQTQKLIGAALANPSRTSEYRSSKLIAAHLKELEKLQLHELMRAENPVQATWPLHPMAVLALPDLCARYAQNERTLFSFLRSDDPGALPRFRAAGTAGRILLGLDGLFDYFVESARSQLMATRGARRWLEVEARISDARQGASDIQLVVLKSVGLLNLITAGGALRASREVVEYACLDDPSANERRAKLSTAIDALIDSGLLTYRHFADELRVWAGSDFDLSAAFERAHLDLGHTSVAELLQEFRPRLPVVAGRFSSRTAAIRAFECRYVDDPEHLMSLQPSTIAYDGVIGFWVGADAAPRNISVDGVRPVVLVHATEVSQIRHAAVELAAYRRVLHHSPQLESDWVARRELVERLALAEQRLDHAVWCAFDSAELTPSVRWLNRNGGIVVKSRRLSMAVSDVATQAYPLSPRVPNEVINRQELTSQGAAARRTLIEAMLMKRDREALGIKGFGPEQTMYTALLGASGIHAARDGDWQFGPPSRASELTPVWKHMEDALTQSHFRKLNVAELFRALTEPPFGVRMGPLPVLLTGFLLAHEDDVAVYEHATYQPDLSPEFLERLAKNPVNFEIRSFSLRQGARMALIEKARRDFGLPIRSKGRNSTLVSVVKPILNTFRVTPDYARHTQRLSNQAKNIRQALVDAREPDQLLFQALPQALGFDPFGVKEIEQDPKAFVVTLKNGLKELQEAFPSMLIRLRGTMARLLWVREDAVRSTLRDRASRLIDRATGGLSSFLIASADPMNSDEDWLQRLATGLIGKAPKTWRDEDEAYFETRIRDCIGAMCRLEFLYGPEIEGLSTYRVCLTLSDGTERVLISSSESTERLNELAVKVVEDATRAAGPGGPAALVKHLLEMLSDQRQISVPRLNGDNT